MAQVLGAVAVDTVGIVAGANEHGAEQCAEVEAVPLLVLEHSGRGVQVQGLGTAGWSVQLPPAPRQSPQGWAPGPVCRLNPNGAPPLCWFRESAKNGVKTIAPVSRKCNPHLPVIPKGHGLLPGGKDRLDVEASGLRIFDWMFYGFIPNYPYLLPLSLSSLSPLCTYSLFSPSFHPPFLKRLSWSEPQKCGLETWVAGPPLSFSTS